MGGVVAARPLVRRQLVARAGRADPDPHAARRGSRRGGLLGGGTGSAGGSRSLPFGAVRHERTKESHAHSTTEHGRGRGGRKRLDNTLHRGGAMRTRGVV